MLIKPMCILAHIGGGGVCMYTSTQTYRCFTCMYKNIFIKFSSVRANWAPLGKLGRKKNCNKKLVPALAAEGYIFS